MRNILRKAHRELNLDSFIITDWNAILLKFPCKKLLTLIQSKSNFDSYSFCGLVWLSLLLEKVTLSARVTRTMIKTRQIAIKIFFWNKQKNKGLEICQQK